MVLDVIRHVAAEEKKLPPPGLSRRISDADPQSLEALLARELSAYVEDGDLPADFARRAIGFAEFVAPGHLRIRTKEEYRVQKQIAGNRYVGIGVTAGMHQPTKQFQFLSVVPGGAAAKAGVQRDDIVESETVEVVTLDFRGLSGRNLHHGILMGSALLDEQPIGQVETTGGMRKITAEPGALFGDRKLVIENGFVQCPVFLTRRGKWATSSIVGLYI